jgi:UTP--glucose-1-phosphate uridylyltransferase
VRSLVEKPRPEAAPSELAVIGRHVLDAAVMERLAVARPTVNGEVQLTDSIAATCTTTGVSAVRYDGLRFDCGNFAGLLQANIAVSQIEEARPGAGIAQPQPDAQAGGPPLPGQEASAA